MVIELVEIIGLFNLGYTKQAFSFLSKLLHKSKTSESLSEILYKLYDFSQKCVEQKKVEIALQLFTILEELSTKLKNYAKLCDIKNLLSYCYRTSRNITASLAKCLEALEIVAQMPEMQLKMPALHMNASAIYKEDLNDLQNALTHAKLAYIYATETFIPNDSCRRTVAISSYYYAQICEDMSDLKAAEEWYKTTLRFCEEQWEDRNLIEILTQKLRILKKKARIIIVRSGLPNRQDFLTRLGTSQGNRSKYADRKYLNSQSSKRQRTKIEGDFTPFPLRSISSNEKSTTNSTHEPTFKIRKSRNRRRIDITLHDIDFS